MNAIKDPGETLDFSVDMQLVLLPGEVITTHDVTAIGVTVLSFSRAANVVTASIAGGVRFTNANAFYRIVTNQGRTMVFTLRIQIGAVYVATP